jgi:predicted dienelactone hydrolase
MKLPHAPLSLLLLLPACGDSGSLTTETGTASTGSETTDAPTTGEGPGSDTPATTTPTTGGPGTASNSGSETGSTSDDPPLTTSTSEPPDTSTGAVDETTTAGTTTDDTTTGDSDELYDPNEDGPWQVANLKGSYTVNNVKVATDAYYPSGGPEPGPYPVVLIAHGFQLPVTQYTKYAQRLASHGYVALTVDFQAGLFDPDHVAYAKQVVGGIDWVAAEPTLKDLADTNNVGLTGHSLGGKLSIFGAVMDNRVRASITLDPVDSAVMCDQVKCPDVSNMLPIDIPLGFVGETLDGEGGFMPCAPAADNFLTYYKNATAPALAVTVNGANHMSFIDDVASCGITCNFCKMPTLTNKVVNDLSRAYVVAFYSRYLKDIPGYDTYLTGADAKARYVDTNLVTLASK